MNDSTSKFGGDDKYYAHRSANIQGPNSESFREYKIVRGLLRKVDDRIRNRVQRTYRQWNTVIRNHIRDETRLKLSEGEIR